MRSGREWSRLARFAVVGGSGVIINMGAMVAMTLIGPHPEVAIAAIPFTEFHVRWYHAYSFTAFILANLWNFQLNRSWTFRSRGVWGREYRAFLLIGVLTQVLGLGILTLLMHPHSPLALPPAILDDSGPLRMRIYWAQLLTIAVVTPASFLLNRFWTFAGEQARS